MTGEQPTVDLVTAEIIRNGLVAAAQEMNSTLVRTAYNPLLFEVKDFGIAITSARGELWAEDPGQAVFSGCMPATIRNGLVKHGPDGFAEGDVLIVNDPYVSGTHISDTCIYMPVFHRGTLVAFAGVMAHWADVGGRTPGGWDADSTELYQEGKSFTYQRLYRAGVANDDLFDFIAHNVRFGEVVRGDIDAQIAACRQGVTRTRALCDRYGADAVERCMAEVIERTAKAMRRRVAELPDGRYSDSVDLDHDGVDKRTHVHLQVAVTVRGDRISMSFDGSSPMVTGPVNVPEIATRSAACAALKGVFAPLEQTNEGHLAFVDFDIPPGLVCSAARPAPCDSYGYVLVAATEVIQLALVDAVPERTRAGGCQLTGAFIYRPDPRDGTPFIAGEPVAGGHGAHPDADGATMPFFGSGDTQNLPAEVAETRYPLMCVRYAFDPGSAGAGAHRGGFGLLREYEMRGEGIYIKNAQESSHDPLGRGVHGGRSGRPSSLVVRPGTPDEAVTHDRLSAQGPLGPGDVVRLVASGGGGWGDPLDRDPGLVARDVRDEFVTAGQARETYGVVVTGSGGATAPDPAATAALRARLRTAADSDEEG
ncbi:hydantoinase B/oxoprolinase family protein [Streptomyces sp. NPDC055078]